MKNALVLVDFQNEWLDKDSEYFVGDIEDVIRRIISLINFCRKNGYKIIFTKHIEPGSGPFAAGSKNSDIIETLHTKMSDTIVTKNKISPFFMTTLDKELEGIDSIVICGILTNLCVRSLIEEAYDRDFNITVIKDCCVSFDSRTQEFTFKDLKSTREEIEFVDVEEFMRD